MSAPKFGRFQKITTLLPLALLSTAVTASMAGLGPASTAVAGQQQPTTLPDGSSVPTEAIEAPASVSTPGVVAPGLRGGTSRSDAASASNSDIPAAALAAYQRAETVINAADRSCQLPWELLAAIGRVESDHGRYGGNTLDDDGVATPGIYGIALNGKNDTRAISDTDAGQYDADATWDRAVGPMQFIPSTWSVVGVDGDNDGKRNPQDIDDAALASAVYLCSGKDDLSTTDGQRKAVFRYNHSQDYVDLVLAFMDAYMSGDFTEVPNAVYGSVGSTSSGGFGTPGFFVPAPEPRGGKNGGGRGGNGGNAGNGGSTGGTGGDTGGTVTDPPTSGGDGDDGGVVPDLDLPEVDDPITGGGGSGGGGGTGDGGGSDGGGGGEVVDDTVDQISKAKATTLCLAEVGVSSVAALVLPAQQQEFDACMAGYGY